MKRSILITIVMAAAFVAAIFVYKRYDPASHPMYPQCPFFGMTGLHCPGCGSQRAIHHLANAEWYQAANDNVLVYMGLLVIVYNLTIRTHNHFYPKARWKNILYSSKVSWGILVLVLGFWLLRNLPIVPFDWLAPG
ncbi:MAG: DUF2752 domain-containing protein [Bacteroidia bacterium]